MNDYIAEKQTANWLKQNGMNEGSFMAMDALFVQAQQIAHNLIKHNLALLNETQIALLNSYLTKSNNKATRRTLTSNNAYAVMKIGKQINRQLFKAYKAINTSR
jgi:hypothetical protein